MPELITRLTAWLALALYAAAVLVSAGRKPSLARQLWTLGCTVFLAHVFAAFHLVHHWSHAHAADATREQALKVTGVHFNGGMWFNYAFALIWLADMIAWWRIGAPYREHFPRWNLAIQLWFLFMAFNAAVIFANGIPARIAGSLLCLAAALALFRTWRKKREP